MSTVRGNTTKSESQTNIHRYTIYNIEINTIQLRDDATLKDSKSKTLNRDG